MKSDEELVYLRVSVARIAQALGVETKRLPVLNKSTKAIVTMAMDQSRGWNDLAACIANRLADGILVHRADAKVLAAALREHDSSDYAHALLLKLTSKT